MFVPTLTDVFNLASITKGMIPLLEKSSRHGWEELDVCRHITLLKILFRVLRNCWKLVISDFIVPEQNNAVKVDLTGDKK